MPQLVFLLLLLLPASAAAHTIGLSTGEYSAKGASVVAKLAFARNEIASVAPGIDTNHDGYLSAGEIGSSHNLLRDKVFGRIEVTSSGEKCAPVITDAGLTEEDGLLLSGRWDCASGASGFDVHLALLQDLSSGHRHVARAVSGSKSKDQVLFGGERRFHIDPSDAVSSGEPARSEGAHTAAPGFGSFLWMGIEHILTGYDHLVFLFGLVLLRARLKSLLMVVTAFTVAHSITLALAVLNIWSPSPKIIEPAIALSIAYVGVENFLVKDANKRWRITFPFGLIHGFGFASALKEVGLSASSVPATLVSFNLGVEVGQLFVLSLLLPLLHFLRKKSWFEPTGVRVLSGVVTAAGLIWFVLRVG